ADPPRRGSSRPRPALRGRLHQARAGHRVAAEDAVRGRDPGNRGLVPVARSVVAADQARRVPPVLRTHVRPEEGLEGGQGVRRSAALLPVLFAGLVLAGAAPVGAQTSGSEVPGMPSDLDPTAATEALRARAQLEALKTNANV